MYKLARTLKQIENEQAQKVHDAGFKIVDVTAEELEDGVGATVGLNAVKDEVFYSLRDALREIGESVDFMALAFERLGR
jgi:hypothetical protein